MRSIGIPPDVAWTLVVLMGWRWRRCDKWDSGELNLGTEYDKLWVNGPEEGHNEFALKVEQIQGLTV